MSPISMSDCLCIQVESSNGTYAEVLLDRSNDDIQYQICFKTGRRDFISLNDTNLTEQFCYHNPDGRAEFVHR